MVSDLLSMAKQNVSNHERRGNINNMKQQYTGRLISIEGIDGSGKSTLTKSLVATLSKKGFITRMTKEPGGTALGTSLRALLQTKTVPTSAMTEFLLFAADRAQHFQELIIPALRDGTIVIADRLADSSLAYQGYGRGLDKVMITTINKWVMQGISPDLTIYLRIDPVVASKRIQQRGEILTAFEQEKLDFWQRVAQGYDDILSQRNNVITLDATLSELTLTEFAVNEVLRLIE